MKRAAYPSPIEGYGLVLRPWDAGLVRQMAAWGQRGFPYSAFDLGYLRQPVRAAAMLDRMREEGPHRHFSVPAGGMVCPACRPTGSSMPSPVTSELLDALLTGDWDRAEASQGTNRREGSGLVAALLQWHLERGLRSLALVDRS